MRILIVRLGALGDIVHGLPVVAALQRARPDATIDWLVSARHAAVLAHVPAVAQRHVVNDRRGAAEGRSIPAVLGALRACDYDVAIDLQGLVKSALLARLSGARRVIGFARNVAREPLASLCYTETVDPSNDGTGVPMPARHVTALNLSLLVPLGVPVATPAFPVLVPPSSVADHVCAQVGGRFGLLNPGAAWPNKRWPPERFGALAAALARDHGLVSVVLSGPGEEPLAAAVVSHAAGAAIAAPPTTVGDVLALAARCAVMVTGDTGPAHLGVAVGAPLVGIYGPTRPERNGPVAADDVCVSRATSCACHHQRRCRRERMCLMEIDVDDVRAAVAQRLARVEAMRG